MAKHILLPIPEYIMLEKSTRAIHADCIEHMDTLIKQLQKLDGKGGNFKVHELSSNIAMLIDEIRNIKAIISTIFKTHEEVLNGFIVVVEDYDVL
jgi:hypothetical protein